MGSSPGTEASSRASRKYASDGVAEETEAAEVERVGGGEGERVDRAPYGYHGSTERRGPESAGEEGACRGEE